MHAQPYIVIVVVTVEYVCEILRMLSKELWSVFTGCWWELDWLRWRGKNGTGSEFGQVPASSGKHNSIPGSSRIVKTSPRPAAARCYPVSCSARLPAILWGWSAWRPLPPEDRPTVVSPPKRIWRRRSPLPRGSCQRWGKPFPTLGKTEIIWMTEWMHFYKCLAIYGSCLAGRLIVWPIQCI